MSYVSVPNCSSSYSTLTNVNEHVNRVRGIFRRCYSTATCCLAVNKHIISGLIFAIVCSLELFSQYYHVQRAYVYTMSSVSAEAISDLSVRT